ncbi:MAG: hypothetical protein SFV32_13715 [Opitutaceae bacterium]|nr:hypothetical protein [Opitutaceae bacterium]
MPLTPPPTDVFHGAPLRSHDWSGSFINGREPVRQLRELAMKLSSGCPQSVSHTRCPFRLIETLSFADRRKLITRMNRNALLQLFAMEHACRREADINGPHCHSPFAPSGS